MPPSPNPFDPGRDPVYDAYLAKYNYGRSTAQTDAELRKGRADQEYQQALASLAQQQERGARNVNTAMLSRNVFRSGETSRRQAELSAAGLQARSAADQSLANTKGTITSDLDRQLASLDIDREQQVAASKVRIAEEDRLAAERAAALTAAAAGGGGGGGARAGAPAPAAPPTARAIYERAPYGRTGTGAPLPAPGGATLGTSRKVNGEWVYTPAPSVTTGGGGLGSLAARLRG